VTEGKISSSVTRPALVQKRVTISRAYINKSSWEGRIICDPSLAIFVVRDTAVKPVLDEFDS
jgi:hypothetical protein